MKRRTGMAFALVVIGACATNGQGRKGQGDEPDTLYQTFRDPPVDARPFVRWWWNGGRVNEREILRELDVMRAAGIGGVEINTIAMPEGPNEDALESFPALSWLSPQWNRMVQVAAEAARARGMTADLIVGSGWPFGGRLGNALRAMFVDSLELDHANWTGDAAAEFARRRGYDLGPYLPFVLEADDPASQTAFAKTVRRARYDWLRTLVELFDERFVTTYVQWCEDSGVRARIQAYGRETHPLHGSMRVHLPEGETWLWLDRVNKERISVESTVVNKYVSSAAHLTGQRLLSFEAMTNAVPVFREKLEDFKLGLDLTFLDGLNHPIIHGFNYTPPEAGFPGWVRFGSYLNERSPYWRYFRRFSDYAARMGAVLRGSEPVAQVAILAPRPEEWAHHGQLYQPFPEVHYPWYQYHLARAVHHNGFGADFISESILEKTSVSEDKLSFGPRAYELLIVEDVEAMEVTAAAALRRFAEAGGRVVFVGKSPLRVPGLGDADVRDAQVRAHMNAIRRAPRVTFVAAPEDDQKADLAGAGSRGPRDIGALVAWTRKALAATGVVPSVVFDDVSNDVSQVHHRDGNTNMYFIANASREKAVTMGAAFPHADGQAWRWDPETGLRAPFPMTDTRRLAIHLEPLGSLLLVFDPGAKVAGVPAPVTAPDGESLAIPGPWTVELRPAGEGTPSTRNLPSLVDLSKQTGDPELATFGGVAVYQTSFNVPDAKQVAALDLGAVHSASEVSLNGKPLGVRWYGRHLYDVRSAIEAGDNKLEIRVATVLANFMKAKKDDRSAQRWAFWFPPIPTGLEGPVRLLYSGGTRVTPSVGGTHPSNTSWARR